MKDEMNSEWVENMLEQLTKNIYDAMQIFALKKAKS